MRITAAAVLFTIVAAAGTSHAASTVSFRFQNNFWINLHHVLRGDARRTGLKLPLTVPLDSLTPAERAAWSEAVTAYADLATRNLVFDERLIAVSNALSRETNDTLPEGVVDEPIRRALVSAAPIYRAHGWR